MILSVNELISTGCVLNLHELKTILETPTKFNQVSMIVNVIEENTNTNIPLLRSFSVKKTKSIYKTLDE